MLEIKVLASSSKGNCFYIDDGKTPLLLDCGINVKRIKHGLNYELNKVVGCLITHEHKDHCLAIKDLLKSGIDCYASEGTIDALVLKQHHRLHAVKAKRQFTVNSWTILPFELQHDATEPLGFLLQSDTNKVLYLTDSYYCKYNFKGLTHILIECNYAKDIIDSYDLHPARKNRLLQSHFELSNVKNFLRASNLSQTQAIYLIHLSDKNSDEKRFKTEIQAVTGLPVIVC